MRRHGPASRAAACGVLLLSTSACTGDSGLASENAATVRDSAGVTIVESAAPAWAEGEGWSLSGEPLLEIGMAAGPSEYLLDRVTGALRLADGTIVVANSRSSELRFYDAAGDHLLTAGGRGAGPGEFGHLGWAALLPGDTILVYDGGNHRLSRFNANGEFVATTTLADPPTGGFPMILGAFRDGSILGKVTITGGEPPPQGVPHRSPEEFIRFSPAGAYTGSITTRPGDDLITRTSATAGGLPMISVAEPLFGRKQLVGAVGELAVFGANDAYELQLYRLDGTLEGIIRRSMDPRPANDAIVEAAKAQMIAQAAPGEARRRRKEWVQTLPHMPTLPFYSSLIGDAKQNLWVEDFHVPGEEPPHWAVFDADGRYLGQVALPDRFRPTHIGSDFVLGITLDEMDVERVQMYGLTRPETD